MIDSDYAKILFKLARKSFLAGAILAFFNVLRLSILEQLSTAFAEDSIYYTAGLIFADVVFAFGLITVLVLGASLYTGIIQNFVKSLIIANDFDYDELDLETLFKKLSPVLEYGLILAFNVLGAFVVSSALSDALPIPEKIIGPEPVLSLMLYNGFFCGCLMTTAVTAWNLKQRFYPLTIICVVAFLLIGYNHCIVTFCNDVLSGATYGVTMYHLFAIAIGNTLGSISLKFLMGD